MKCKFVNLIFIVLLSSCSFNKLYLHPTKVAATTKKIKINIQEDTYFITFGENFQPTFLDTLNNIVPLNFSIESVVFESTSGNRLNGWMLKSKEVKPIATILNFHGNAGLLLSHYRSMIPLLSYGLQIFMFDYSGFGFSEGKATRKNVLQDAYSALDYLKRREDIDSHKIILYGQSLGGHLSVVVATERQDEILGLVTEGAFSSHKDIAAETAGFLGRILVNEKYSASKSIENFHRPFLIIHSEEDETIPFRMGKKLFEKANPPKEFYTIQHCHICGTEFYAEAIAKKILKMVK